mmetsp:Transcript_7427/g.32987  ORF Transcript_7427/g.32987 Transcript_7427/m.32987 type:complete len:320 (-) Transcript_7427:3624-4583(-)
MDHQELYSLADVPQLLPRVTRPVLVLDEPVLELGEAGLDVLAVAERAALAAEQKRIEELDVDEAENLGEELANQEHGYVVGAHDREQGVEAVEDGAPVRAELLAELPTRGGGGLEAVNAAAPPAAGVPAPLPGRLDARAELGGDLLLHVIPQEPVDLLHERGELLLEQERGVLGVNLPHAGDAGRLRLTLLLGRGAAGEQPGVEALEDAAAARALGPSARAAGARLERALQQVQERKGVGQPVGELRVVIGVVLNRDGHLAHDAVKQTRALQLKHPPVQQRAERDARQDGLPAAEPDLAALLDGREEYLVVRLCPRVGE